MNEHTLRGMPKFNKSETSSVGSDKDKDRFKKRQIANNNERRRMRFINLGFQHLRNMLPYYMTSEKMSKANVLTQACERIKSLEEELAYCKSTTPGSGNVGTAAPSKPCPQCGFVDNVSSKTDHNSNNNKGAVVGGTMTPNRLFIRMSDNVQCENVEPVGIGNNNSTSMRQHGVSNIGPYLLYAAKQIELDNLSPSFQQHQSQTAPLEGSDVVLGGKRAAVSGPGMVPGRRKYRIVIPQNNGTLKGVRESYFDVKEEVSQPLEGLEGEEQNSERVVMVRETCVEGRGGEGEEGEEREPDEDEGASDGKKQRSLPPKMQHKSQYKNEVVMVI